MTYDIHYSRLDITIMIVSIKNQVLKEDVNADLIYLQKTKIVQTLSLHLTMQQYGSLLMDPLNKSVLLDTLQRETLEISS